MIRMSRRGQVPIIMLFLIAIVLAITSLFIFSTTGNGFDGASLEVSKTISGVEFGYSYVADSAQLIAKEAIESKSDIPKEEFMQIAAGKDVGVLEAGNFFGRIRSGDFSFEREGDSYALTVDKLFVQAGYGNNLIRRDFNINMKFNDTGDLIE